jgi:hypothetical protein
MRDSWSNFHALGGKSGAVPRGSWGVGFSRGAVAVVDDVNDNAQRLHVGAPPALTMRLRLLILARTSRNERTLWHFFR